MPKTNFLNIYYPESKITGHTHIDGTIAFYQTVHSLIEDKDITVLDLGCGVGGFMRKSGKADLIKKDLRNFKGKVTKVIGADVDPEAATNPAVDEFHLITPGEPLPLEDESVDLCISDYVLEHVEDPDSYFSEIQRVVKKGGHVCLRTVNVYGYVALAAMLIPNRMHAKVTGEVQEERRPDSVFPTVYKCNSRKAIRKYLNKHGFDSTVYTIESEPAYLSFSRVFYHLGYLYQKWAPDMFRNVIFAFGKKL